jgi:hypothetical protein
MTEPRPPATNALGMRQFRRRDGRTGHPKNKGTMKYTSVEEREIRVAWQREVAARSCCISAYFVETVTLTDRIPREAGLSEACPNRCPAWESLVRIPEEMVR